MAHARVWTLAVAALLGTAACGKPPSPVSQAVLLSQSHHDAEAIALLRGHLSKHPEAVAERRLLVRLLGESGDMAAAQRESAELATRLPRNSPEPYIELGHALELGHRYDEALAAYDRAAEVAPVDPAGPRVGGTRAARWGEIDAALPRLEEALRRDPRDAAVWHTLGLVRLHRGDVAGARVAYESGLAANPAALENRVGLATIALRLGEAREALSQYDRLLKERPAFAAGHLGRAWALLLLGRLDDARAALDEARRRGVDEPSIARAVERQEALLEALRKKSQSTGNP
jgi:tetratricopeptide (TPR) repeat protein